MKRISLFIISLFAVAIGASAQLTASSAFTSAPRSVFPLLDNNTRLDMVDYFNSGMDTPSNNLLDGHSVVTALTPSTLTAKIADTSEATVVVLNADSPSPVIMLISTVATPGLDSKISFYTQEWEPITPASKYFEAPELADWLSPAGKGMEGMVMSASPFMLSSATVDPEGKTLTLTNNLSSFLDPEVYATISEYLLPVKVYHWDGKKFK
ncbi:MAG: DUF3256 family protein [Duncaniella sp.]|nr:DUF3256 family protein [Duncaniella sp.]